MHKGYLGLTAAKAQQTHGATSDGMMSSRGGPHHPQAGCYEESNTEDACRMNGVEDLRSRTVGVTQDGEAPYSPPWMKSEC